MRRGVVLLFIQMLVTPMNRRSLLAILSASLGSGCLRLGSGSTPTASQTRSPTKTPTQTESPSAADTESPTETETPTDTDSPTQTAASDSFEYPPGTSPNGLSQTLGNTHQVMLATTPATIERAGTGLQIVADIDEERILGDSDIFDGNIYLNRSEFYLRGTVNQESIYSYTSDIPSDFQRRNIIGGPIIGALAGGADWSVTGVSRTNGQQVIEAVANGVSNGSLIENTESISVYFPASFTVTDVTGTAQITESGITQELKTNITVESGSGEMVTQRFEFSVSEIGSTVVETPTWLPTARKNAPEFDAEFVNDRSAVALSLSSGTDLAGGFEFDTYDDNGYYNASYDGQFERGETLYIWKRGPSAAAVTESPPTGNDPAASYVGNTEYDVRVGPLTLRRTESVNSSQ